MHLVLKAIPVPALHTYSNRVETLFYQQECFKRGVNFGIYSSIKDKEIFTEPIIRQLLLHNKNVFLPVWRRGEPMQMVRIRDWADYASLPMDKHGIRVPVDGHLRDRAMEHAALDVIIVPGVAFDQLGHRLGRGLGYYDSYITTYRSYCETNAIPFPVLIGLAFPEQVLPAGEIPLDAHDQRLDCILSGDGKIYPRDQE